MAIYSIRDLEKLTGIKAHTIRIWEQRYNLIEPARTDSNIRYYTDENLRQLLNIALLNRRGFKISKIASMNKEALNAKVLELTQHNPGISAQIEALTLAMIDLDEPAFERILNRQIEETGFELAMTNMIYPFLDEINLLWLTGSINQVHEKFIGNLLKRKLFKIIEETPAHPSKNSYSFLLYIPDEDSQELTLLYIYYLLRRKKFKTLYLGMRNSLMEVREACQSFTPDYIITIIDEPMREQTVQQYIQALSATAGSAKVLLTGQQVFTQSLQLPGNMSILEGLDSTNQLLDSLEAGK